MILVHTFFFLGEGITNETVHLMDDGPGIISSKATILRLWDDLRCAKVTNIQYREPFLLIYLFFPAGPHIKLT